MNVSYPTCDATPDLVLNMPVVVASAFVSGFVLNTGDM